MSLKSKIPFSKGHHVIKCVPTLKHCQKGQDASASISTLDVLAVSQGIKLLVEVWDQVESQLYVFDAQSAMRALYFCGASDYMAFKYKNVKPLEIK